MSASDDKSLDAELSGRLQILILVRVVAVSLFLGASAFIQIKETRTYFGHIQTSHFLLIAAIYFLTVIYIILLKQSKRLLCLAYLQLLADTVFATAVIYSTGGIDSVFSFLYILTIINGSILLYRAGGMIIASVSSILYGSLLDLHFYGVIHPFGCRAYALGEHQGSHIFYLILVNIAAFYLVALLSSTLSEQIRKGRVELRAKQIDINKLELLNESIINSIRSGLVALDHEERVVLFNPAAEEIFGLPSHEVLGRPAEGVLPVLFERLGREEPLQATLSPKWFGQAPPYVDLPYPRPDGSQLHLRLSVSPLRLPSWPGMGRILFFQNVTEIKGIEEEMKKVEGLALVGELAAAIAHEIRNPMAAISGSIQMMKDGLDKKDVNIRLMDIVLREINRLNHLVKEFLLFARPKKSSAKSFKVSETIKESLELFQNSQYWNGEIRIVADVDPELRIESDPEQLKQVLWNLLLNGSEAMTRGGELLIAGERTRHEGASFRNGAEAAKICVRDTGPGFSKEALEQLFTPFFTTKEGGSGLGLAIVKRIVEGLNGEVSGGNHPDGGAQVTILLPLNAGGTFRRP